MKRILPVILMFSFTYSFAQIEQGAITIGGPGDDEANSMVQTSDGGFALTGYTTSYGVGSENVYVIKLNSRGSIQWTKAIGAISEDNIGTSIIQTYDGGYAITGYMDSSGSLNPPLFNVIKLDASGNIQWTENVGTEFYYNYGYSIIQAKDSGYVITGIILEPLLSANMGIIKLNASGNIQWVIKDGEGIYNARSSIIQTNDGAYVAAGTLGNMGVIKIDTAGNAEWNKVISDRSVSEGTSIIQTHDKGFAVTGYTYYDTSSISNIDVYIVKLDSSGNMKWSRTIGGDSDDEGNSIIQTKDGGYVIAGYTNSFGAGGYDVYVIKLDSSGNLSWTRTIGGTGDDKGESIVQTPDGGYAIAGYTNSYGAGGYDVYFIKLDSLGNLCSGTGSGGSITSIDSGRVSTASVGVGSAIVTDIDMDTESSGGIDSAMCLVLSVSNISPVENSITLFPNPNNGKFNIEISSDVLGIKKTIEVYNMMGENIYSAVLNPSTTTINIDNDAPGVYLYRIITETGNLISEGKFVIQK